MTNKSKLIHNLLKLSHIQKIEEIKHEWIYIGYKTGDHEKEVYGKDNVCLCHRPIKHQHYYYNHITGNSICLGLKCRDYVDERNTIPQRYRTRQYDDIIRVLRLVLSSSIMFDSINFKEYLKRNHNEIILFFKREIDKLKDYDGYSNYWDYLENDWEPIMNVDKLLDYINEKIEILEYKEAQRIKEIIKARLNHFTLVHIAKVRTKEWKRRHKLKILKYEVRRFWLNKKYKPTIINKLNTINDIELRIFIRIHKEKVSTAIAVYRMKQAEKKYNNDIIDNLKQQLNYYKNVVKENRPKIEIIKRCGDCRNVLDEKEENLTYYHLDDKPPITRCPRCCW